MVLDKLAPAERVAFVLHDLFSVPFEEIAPVVERSSTTKKLASRVRHRVRGTAMTPNTNSTRHRQVVAFLAAARGGDINALVALLDPDVVRRADRAALPAHGATEIRGAQAVAEETRLFSQRARFARLALVNGSAGIVVAPRGQLQLALSLTVKDEQISGIDVIADRARLDQLDLAILVE